VFSSVEEILFFLFFPSPNWGSQFDVVQVGTPIFGKTTRTSRSQTAIKIKIDIKSYISIDYTIQPMSSECSL
jgi:hypothetical protein